MSLASLSSSYASFWAHFLLIPSYFAVLTYWARAWRDRGQIIVFKNPHYATGNGDEYIVKRVIAFPGERVALKDGAYTVYNDEHPDGFNPDDANHGEPGPVTSGQVNVVVPDGELFVSGDHRDGNYSYDSRNGLGTIPFYDVVGPVSMRIFPFDKIRLF
jgi:signal peptidase I